MAKTDRDSFYVTPGEQIASGDTLRLANGDGRFYRLVVKLPIGATTDATVTVRDDNTEDSGGTTIATIVLQEGVGEADAPGMEALGEVRYRGGYYFNAGLCIDATSQAVEIVTVHGVNEGDSANIP